MICTVLAITGIFFALIPATTFLANWKAFCLDDDLIRRSDKRATTPGDSEQVEHLSVLIPARDEESGIRQCVQAALANEFVEVEVIVLDDHSCDSTASIVQSMAADDPRVRYLASKPLADGWNGKQHACHQLADAATHQRIVFLDADVRLAANSLRRLIHRQEVTGVSLLSAFPHQQTGTLLEKLIIPMMHFILLGFLPLRRMRSSTHPAYAAGCGQLFVTRKSDYHAAGGHAAIRDSRHDGLKLPRAYRENGLSTDVVDGTDLAECRMYSSAGEVIRGVLKNAIEGIANPRLIVPFSMMLFGGSVLPIATLTYAAIASDRVALLLSILGVVLGHVPRAAAALRFKQSVIGVALHSVATLIFLILQWVALVNHLLGRQIAWRGRA